MIHKDGRKTALASKREGLACEPEGALMRSIGALRVPLTFVVGSRPSLKSTCVCVWMKGKIVAVEKETTIDGAGTTCTAQRPLQRLYPPTEAIRSHATINDPSRATAIKGGA